MELVSKLCYTNFRFNVDVTKKRIASHVERPSDAHVYQVERAQHRRVCYMPP